MTTKTTNKIRKFSRDKKTADSLLLLMDYYGVTNLTAITEEQGQSFLEKLKSGEIRIPEVDFS